MDFFPEGFEPAKNNANYYKPLTDDECKSRKVENKIRILSSPITGWEDWKDGRPIRFRLKQKPLSPIDPKKPVKAFCAMIIWDYVDEKIKIWNVTQATIITQITAFCKDKDWGSPFFYDIKINRSGSSMQTKYVLMCMPHKPVSDQIKEEFKAKPCFLDAIFLGQDPFAQWADVTPPGYDSITIATQSIQTTITKDQYQEILDLIFDDTEYLEKLKANVKQHFNCTLEMLPSSKYQAILHSVKLWAKEKADKEQAMGLPF